MAQSPHPSGRPPIGRVRAVVDLLETPVLARVYTYILQDGPVTVAEIIDELDVPQGTAYDYVGSLEAAGLVGATRDRRPSEYVAEPVSITVSTAGGSRTITAALVAAVARRVEDEDVDVFIERHGLDGLADALDYASEGAGGTVNRRVAARELDLSLVEAETILRALEPVATEDADAPG
jgi:DNA-binding MarR family transcriptional regulator